MAQKQSLISLSDKHGLLEKLSRSSHFLFSSVSSRVFGRSEKEEHDHMLAFIYYIDLVRA